MIPLEVPTSIPDELPESDLQLSLYENAIDSIRHAVEHYSQDPIESRRYKYAILHLAQGVILLLKERLSKEHPNFIYVNVVEDDKTVDVELVLLRLEKIAKLKLEGSKGLVRELAKMRNKIEHYAVTINRRQAASIFVRTMAFLTWFVHDELHKDFHTELGEANWRELVSIEEYLVQAKREVEAGLRAAGQPIYRCDVCQSATATLTNQHPVVPDPWVPNYSYVTCLICHRNMGCRTECRRCGKELFTTGTGVFWNNYCDDCIAQLRLEYPGVEIVQFVAEVRKWFDQHDTITAAQLEERLLTVTMFGSS